MKGKAHFADRNLAEAMKGLPEVGTLGTALTEENIAAARRKLGLDNQPTQSA